MTSTLVFINQQHNCMFATIRAILSLFMIIVEKMGGVTIYILNYFLRLETSFYTNT